MQRFEELQLEDGTIIKNAQPIEKWLYTSPFCWLLECELDGVKLSIKDGILHWKSGILYWGVTNFMVFENGEIRSGTWNSGIFLNGTVGKDVTWKNGVFKGGTFNGKKIAGQFPEDAKEKIT